MKKLVNLAFILPLMIACNQEVKDENAALKDQNKELSREVQQKDSLINDFVQDFATIQENLALIREKEEDIREARQENAETSASTQEEIIGDIESINELLSENRRTIADLNDKVKRYSVEVGKFKKLVENLNAQIAAKDKEINNLKESLASMNFQMDRLNAKLDTISMKNEQQKETIAAQTEALNTAYYAVGTFDDLNKNNVVVKEGGIIGIGSTKTLASDFNKDYFTRIDLRETMSIPLDAEEGDVKMISKHDPSSYKWNKTDKRINGLEITKPELFWKNTKYLVLLTDD